MLQFPAYMTQYPLSTMTIPTSFLLPAQWPQPQNEELLLAMEESDFEEKVLSSTLHPSFSVIVSFVHCFLTHNNSFKTLSFRSHSVYYSYNSLFDLAAWIKLNLVPFPPIFAHSYLSRFVMYQMIGNLGWTEAYRDSVIWYLWSMMIKHFNFAFHEFVRQFEDNEPWYGNIRVWMTEWS